jgi:hypothetical protein
VVLITDDRKEDWVRREHGLILGPRPELCEEMSAAAGQPFLLMSTATFLRHAKEYLNVSVSPGTVDQARELPDALDERRAKLDEMRRDLLQELGELREARRSADMAAAHAAAETNALEHRFRRAQPDLDPAFLAEASADLQRALTARTAVEARSARLAEEQYRIDSLLELLERESAAQGDQRSPLDQMYRERLAMRQARSADQRPTGQ